VPWTTINIPFSGKLVDESIETHAVLVLPTTIKKANLTFVAS
jgi:hypothetical protein